MSKRYIRTVDAERPLQIIEVTWELDNQGAEELIDDIEELMRQGKNHILIDLTRIPFISSVGIGILAFATKELLESNGDLLVACNEEKVLSLLDLSNLSEVVKIYPTVEEAVKHWS